MLFAWGGDGHQIVALIAEERLTPEARQMVHELLGADVNISDAEIASWADNIRREKRSTGPWHYVDIPTTQPSFDEDRDGDNGHNVIDKLTEFEKILADTNETKEKRADALKYVVHFVGDIEQPLHCAERDKDRGGNTRLVFFLDRPRAVNLQQCWDTQILLHDKGTTRILDYALWLNQQVTKEDAERWAKGTPEDWANESHRVAIDVAYKGVPADGDPPKLDEKYVRRAEPVIEEQLEKGGVRTATSEKKNSGSKVFMGLPVSVMVPEFDIYGMNMCERPLKQYIPSSGPDPKATGPGSVTAEYGANSQGLMFMCPSAIDLNNGGLELDFTGSPPVSQIRSLLASGYASGAWNGSGITSSAAASAGTNHPTAIGWQEATHCSGLCLQW